MRNCYLLHTKDRNLGLDIFVLDSATGFPAIFPTEGAAVVRAGELSIKTKLVYTVVNVQLPD